MLTEVQGAAAQPANSNILAALHDASARTGSDFDYLLGTAMRESGLDSQAKSKASSATGLFQFIDQTWLGLVKRYGSQYGLSQYSNAIQQDDSGHYTVASKDTKQAILALRRDPEYASLMAGEAAKETKQNLECALGRKVCGGELYAAHFLGEGGARQLITLKDRDPNAPADEAFPQAAEANRSIFYHADGTAKTVKEVYNWAVKLPDVKDAANIVTAAGHSPVKVSSGAPPMEIASGDGADDSFYSAGCVALKPHLMLQAGRTNSVPSLMASTLPQSSFLLTPGVMEVLSSLNPVAQYAAKRAS